MSGTNVGMLCPNCRVALVMSERQGVEIDYCSQCRGVWLDRGELDKIIERNAQEADVAPVQRPASPDPRYSGDGGYRRDHSHSNHHGRRKKSFLENLFD